MTVDGELAVIRPRAATDSIADLAQALGLGADTPLCIDGSAVDLQQSMISTDLRIGSEVTTRPGSDAPVETTGPVELAVLSGPACQPWRPLAVGCHTIGRSPTATITLVDPTVELHHGIIEVVDDGTVRFTQLTGRAPVRVAGRPCSIGERVRPGDVLQLGASRIALRQAGGAHGGPPPDRSDGSLVAAEHDPWRRIVRRAPATATPALATISVPRPPAEHHVPPLGGLAGAGVAAVGAGLMAAVLGQALFALFALVGAAASAITWAIGALAARRRRARSRAGHQREMQEFAAQLERAHAANLLRHRQRYDDVIDVVAIDERRIWHRTASDSTVTATLGRGTVVAPAPIAPDDRAVLSADLLVAVERCERLVDVPVPVALGASAVVAFHGDEAMAAALARSLIVQLGSSHGPADLRLAIVTHRPDAWSFADWLPHGGADPAPIVCSNPGEFDLSGAPTGRATVVVTDVPDLLTARTGAFRRALDASGAACVVVTPDDTTVPSVCGRVLDVSPTGLARWRDGHSLDDEVIQLSGITTEVAAHVARRLAPLVDPEDQAGPGSALPRRVQLADLGGVDDAATIARRWRSNGRDPAVSAMIGVSHDGTIELDLVRDGPHGLIAGTTGSGKSELLRTLVVSLAAQVSPDHLSFVLIDFKGGSTFDACARLPHTVGVVTDLDEGLASRALVSLDAEVSRRERLLRAVAADDLASYRLRAGEPLPRLVVVVDEFASLAKELPEFLDALVAIAQRGRSLGLHLILATQRPAGVVTDEIRANTNLRLALRLHDRSDAIDVVGDAQPAAFPKGVSGRAALRLGPDDLVVFQTASCTGAIRADVQHVVVEWPERHDPGTDRCDDARDELTTLVDAILDAAAIQHVRRPHRPWVDPLPGILGPAEIDADPSVVGVIDDPATQSRAALRWDRSRGHLLLVGGVGSGTTTTAFTIAASCVRSSPAAELHLYVLDGNGEERYDLLADADHCGAVVRLAERERTDRLLGRLDAELDRRVATGDRRPSVVVVIDGLRPVRSALAPRADSVERLDRILQDGPAAGIVVCATAGASSADTLGALPAVRWVFELDEDRPHRSAGTRPVVPGRVRLADSGLMAQVVFEPDVVLPPAAGRAAGGPPPIETLPDVVDAVELDAAELDAAVVDRAAPPVAGRSNAGHRSLLVGIAADDLSPAHLEVPRGDHVFIGGGARTGTSTALRQLVVAWRRLHPDGLVVDVDCRNVFEPGVLDVSDEHLDAPPLLLAVDDADRVQDPTGALLSLVTGRRAGVTVIAAARLEAVRVAYGHWVREVTRNRCGLIMTSATDIDGELLGVSLPRRSMIPARAGLAWMVDGRGHRLVQVAARMQT